MLSAKQGNYWYHFYNVFGMTRSLTGFEPETASTVPLGYRGGGFLRLIRVHDADIHTFILFFSICLNRTSKTDEQVHS